MVHVGVKIEKMAVRVGLASQVKEIHCVSCRRSQLFEQKELNEG